MGVRSERTIDAGGRGIAPIIFSSLEPAKTTVVFDAFWRFAAERQEIFYARLRGTPEPWTNDSILQEYKFTNSYRASDRVSQYLIRNVIYRGDSCAEEVFFRILLFKLFNKIETWQLLESQLGEITWRDYNYAKYNQVLTTAIKSEAIYSAAYIMASGHERFGVTRKHEGHLKLIESMMEESVALRVAACSSMRAAFELLKSYPLMGDFLAYQIITDLNYSEIINFSEMEFVVPGPGAKDGIRKCFSSLGGLSEVDVIRLMADRQAFEFKRLDIDFKDLGGRALQLIDIQNVFCEISKYARVAYPSVAGLSGRTRIKQKYRKTAELPPPFYPPKWNLAAIG